VYDRNRTFYTTMSPSMDILISSNLERLLYAVEQDSEAVRGYMEQLNACGKYEVSDKVKAWIAKRFCAGFCDDAQTAKVIERIYRQYDYLIDTHTAVAFDVMEQYRRETGDETAALVVSTASPFKFCDSVLTALGQTEIADGLAVLDQLTEVTGRTAPVPLAGLRDKRVRFTASVDKERMEDVVLGMLD